MSPEISERSFEESVERGLIANGPDAYPGDSTVIGEIEEPYGRMVPGGHYRRRPEDYDRGLCLLRKLRKGSIPMTTRLKTSRPGSVKRNSSTTRRLAVVLGILGSFLFRSEARPAAQEDWNDVVSKARREGKAALATTIPGMRAAAASFQKQFGLELQVNVFGSNSKLDVLAAAECAAGQPSIDVLMGGPTELVTLYPKGCLAPIKPKLLLPEVTDPAKWKGGFLKWNDPEGQYILQTGEYVSGRIAVNTQQIKPGMVATARDLLKPEFRGKIASYDPRLPGLGSSMAGTF
jgi:hypothetical protein